MWSVHQGIGEVDQAERNHCGNEQTQYTQGTSRTRVAQPSAGIAQRQLPGSAMRVTIGCRVRLKGLPGYEGKIGTVLNSFRSGFTIELDGGGRVFAETRHLKVRLHQ